jgi:hypothetical protein
MPESFSVSHSRDDESFQEKARWFQSQTLEQRMEIFCEMSELILANRPELVRDKPHAEPVPGRVQVLELEEACGRDVDLSDVSVLREQDDGFPGGPIGSSD